MSDSHTTAIAVLALNPAVDISYEVPQLVADRSDDYVVVFDGGSGDDTLIGSDARDRLDGGRGNDLLFGFGGDDRLYGDGAAGPRIAEALARIEPRIHKRLNY